MAKQNNKKKIKRGPAHKLYWIVVLGAIVYIVLTLTAPIANNRFDLTNTEIRLLQLTLVIPVSLIWLAAFYGAVHFKNYALRIKDSKEGPGLNNIANGLSVLVIGLIVGTLVSTLRSRVDQSGNTYQQLTIVYNYLSTGFPLVAFIMMFNGSRKMITMLRGVRRTVWQTTSLVVGVGILASIFTYGIFTDPYRNTTPDPSQFASYFLPDWALLTTFVFPTIILWGMGAIVGFILYYYTRGTKGEIYKQALRKLTIGLIAVIGFSIFLHLFNSIGPSLADSALGAVLTFIYVVIILYAVGYLFIASGAKSLSKIEEV